MQAAPKPQPQAPMTRAQKLKSYSGQQIEEANAAEKAGAPATANSKNLQAADILLLLAKVEENYTAWKYYADTAESCQKRARMLIAAAPKEETQP